MIHFLNALTIAVIITLITVVNTVEGNEFVLNAIDATQLFETVAETAPIPTRLEESNWYEFCENTLWEYIVADSVTVYTLSYVSVEEAMLLPIVDAIIEYMGDEIPVIAFGEDRKGDMVYLDIRRTATLIYLTDLDWVEELSETSHDNYNL